MSTVPVLYHDGCHVCLGIAELLAGAIPALRVVDLGLDGSERSVAAQQGVTALPCLVVGGKVLPVSPHSNLAGLDSPVH